MTSSRIVGVGLVGIAVALGSWVAAAGQLPRTAGPGVSPAVAEPEWKADFRKAYGLKDGELLRRVSPPHPECRMDYFAERVLDVMRRNKQKVEPGIIRVPDYSNHFTTFVWKDGWPVDDLTQQTMPVKPDEGVRLARLIAMTTGFGHTRIEGDAHLLDEKVTGDFVIRADAEPARIAAALGQVLRKECGMKVTLAVQEVEREVYVLTGKYESQPLKDRKKDFIEVYASALGDRSTGGGGNGSLQKMADAVEGFIGVPVVVEVGRNPPLPQRVEWHFNFRSPATHQETAEDTDADAVMKNITAQTGLTAKREKRKIRVLKAEPGK